MKNLIGQKNNDSAKQPSSVNGMMYGCSVGEYSQEVHGTPSHVEDANTASEPCTSGKDKSAGREIYITDYVLRNNNKDSEYFVRFQFVVVNDDGSKRLYVTNNGSFEIKEFFKLVDSGAVSLPVHTRICSEGTSYYFEQFHTSNQEACSLICKQLGI